MSAGLRPAETSPPKAALVAGSETLPNRDEEVIP